MMRKNKYVIGVLQGTEGKASLPHLVTVTPKRLAAAAQVLVDYVQKRPIWEAALEAALAELVK